jgi:hypothetical protein
MIARQTVMKRCMKGDGDGRMALHRDIRGAGDDHGCLAGACHGVALDHDVSIVAVLRRALGRVNRATEPDSLRSVVL